MVGTILIRGEKEDKIYNKTTTWRDAYPAVFDDGLSMGVALLQDYGGKRHGSFWGLVGPRLLITSFRGMKIAEEVKEFEDSTLCSCWYAGNRAVSERDRESYVDSIEAKIGRERREEILKMVPPNVDQVLTLMREKNISFDAYELEMEVKKGRMKKTAVVKQTIKEYNKYLEELRREREPDKKSGFTRYLSRLNIFSKS